MKFHELNVQSHKSPKRAGRGIAAGRGKTAGRGTKGQKSRTGKKLRPGFEGGQNPLMQRLPKLHGFRSLKPASEVIYISQLDALGKKVDTDVLAKAGLISSPYATVKLLVRGEVTKPVNVSLQAASSVAIEKVQKAGGTFEKVERVKRPITSTNPKKQSAEK